ncbi:MAG: inosine/xanthosine triphosphatase [Candidatus Pacebacteria bacterium CG_4_10_14_0_8_um_filter_42_14]|nr:MAG: inosine/xanthosine triphosphatase [Candidatus Pacebacteria bacterium CG_4_10_14_0_8_um_filter_42_14]
MYDVRTANNPKLLKEIMKLFVGSTNPVKLNAARVAAEKKWPDVEIISCEVESGISEQPLTDEETRKGARNRAIASLATKVDESRSDEALGIGLEGGVFTRENNELWSTVWVAVADSLGNIYESNGARFRVPEAIAESIRAGEEMGPVVSRMFGGRDVRSTNGAIGIITRDFVDRTEEYAAIAKMALGIWYGRKWQEDL